MKKLYERLRSGRSPAPINNPQEETNREPSTLSFPDGVEVLHDCPDATVDICFVHGLTGNRISTWTAHGQTAPWPKTLLPEKLSKARILTYGYDAYIVSKAVASSNRLIDHATNLLVDLTNDRAGSRASSRPLIFIAHSLGGLICKEAILTSRNNPDRRRRDIFTHLKGIIFMGTPHKGSWMADWAKMPASALGLIKSTNKSLLRILETDDQLLESIQARFLALVREQREAGRQLQVTCFFEELPLPVVGKVVSKDSATLEGYDPITIHANHGDMVKFRCAEENGFKRLAGELTVWESEIGRSISTPEAVAPQAYVETNTTMGKERVISAKHTMHYLPFLRNRNFVGRKDVIETLKCLLTGSDEQRIALVGLGGMGKTQIALQLAHLVKSNSQEYENCSVIWIPALSMASFEQACTTIVNKFGIKCAGDEDPKEIIREFLSSDKAGKWLLIIDNADDMSVLYGSTQQPGGIADFLPDSDNGRILFTTRSQGVAVGVAGSCVVELSEMGPEEAKALLQKSLIKKDQVQDDELVGELLQKLTHLPLAISQASAYMNTNKVPIKEYLRLFQNTDKDMVELLSRGFRDGSHYRSAQGAVATTWIVSFNQIRDTDGDAARLLSFAAHIEPKAIPRTLLPTMGSEQRMTQAIGTLCGYSFLNRQEDSETFDMHSLVHLATKLWNASHDLERQQRQAATIRLAEVFPTDAWENRELWRQYLPHALRVLKRAVSDESKEFCELGFWVGRCLLRDGRTREAVDLLEYVVSIREKTLAENHPDRLASQHNLARAYQANGQIEKAVDLLEHVVSINEKTLAENHPDRLASQNNLARAYQANGQIDKAADLLEHVVSINEKTLAESHPDRLTSQHNLAGAYQANGQIDKAVDLLEYVVSIREKILAENHPDRLASQHTLAVAYQANGQIDKAVDLLEHVVSINEKMLAENHLSRLASQNNLARAYQANGQIEKAVDLLEHVVSINEKILVENHPDRLTSQHTLAVAYQANGQVEKAVELLEHVVAINEKTLAVNHPDRLASQHNLARAYQANSQIKKAVELLEHVVAMKKEIMAENHPDRLASQHTLAVAYQANGQIEKAVEQLEHVVAINEKTLAENHPDRLASQHNLAVAYQANGQIEKAVELLQHVVAMKKEIMAETYPSRLVSEELLQYLRNSRQLN
ncbi:NB-ARC domain-containing protein [Fusarium sp. Ph1]|nr:NB-ARC domain-containing protein [Fusarium sp. Ph1]